MPNFDLSPGFAGVVEKDRLAIPAASLGILSGADHDDRREAKAEGDGEEQESEWVSHVSA